MNGDLNHIATPVGPEDDQELWRVLGRAKKAEASPYFARRVLREAAFLTQTRPVPALWRGLQAWWQAGLPLLRPPRAAAWPGAFAAAAICAVTVLTTFHDGSNLRVTSVPTSWQPAAPETANGETPAPASSERTEPTRETASADENTSPINGADVASEDTLTPQDAELIADLDTLLAREETHLWTDDSTAY